MTLLVIEYTDGNVEAYPDARFVNLREFGILRWQQGLEDIHDRKVDDIANAYRITDDGSEYGIGLINLIGAALGRTIATYPTHRRTPEARQEARARKLIKRLEIRKRFNKWKWEQGLH